MIILYLMKTENILSFNIVVKFHFSALEMI